MMALCESGGYSYLKLLWNLNDWKKLYVDVTAGI